MSDLDFNPDEYISIEGWEFGMYRGGSRSAISDETVLVFRGDELVIIDGDNRLEIPERVVLFLLGLKQGAADE